MKLEHLYRGYPVRTAINNNKKPNLVDKPGETDKLNNLKQTDRLSVLKPNIPAVTSKPEKPERSQTTTTPTTKTTPSTPSISTTNAGTFEHWEESDLFSSQPNSDLDALGKKRYVAPHVIYKTDKKPDEPCSITTSLNYFPEDQPSESNATTPPKAPPSNLTVVTVEEYEVISTAKGPDGEHVSILTTSQTHTAVENLKPESSYEFKVLPKNDLGAGPPSEPVSFSTESGKDAIWTQFPFKTDSFSDCTGKQYVKRTWYRKFVGVQLCNSLRYKIYLSDSLTGKFYNIGDESGFSEDHCQFVDSFLDGKTGRQLRSQQLPTRTGYYRAVRQEPVRFGEMGGDSHVSYVSWYECGTPIPGKW
ncbi:hypothetical protein CRUP_007302 [Coryphaenoides rupestris]|nr:hypothetical protein CRUP_007302 [Coryphaenoides rupestris]